MGAIKEEIRNIEAEIQQVKVKIHNYRMFLIGSFYWGGALLLLVFIWIIFPPEENCWRLASNSCFVLLLLSLWISYWLINKIKFMQRIIGELRIKLRQMVWGKICDCQEPCDCKEKIERAMVEEYNDWSDGILAEVKHEI